MKRSTSLLMWLTFIFLMAGFAAHAQDATRPVKITLTTIDVPGATVTEINGINKAGKMVGAYGSSTSGSLSGFVYSDGGFTDFAYPGQSVTYPGGINDSGLIVGYATQDAGERFTVVGFLYDGTTFTTLQDGSNNVTNAYGINNAGTVVGSVGTSLNSWSGFEEKSNRYRAVKLPGGCPYSDAEGINNTGLIVGTAYCGTNNYAYQFRDGKTLSVQYPGAPYTSAFGVNDSGVIVGWFAVTDGCDCAFAFMHGKFLSFSYPGALFTSATGINGLGQIVGSYTFDFNAWHGFVTSSVTHKDFVFLGCCQTAVVEAEQ